MLAFQGRYFLSLRDDCRDRDGAKRNRGASLLQIRDPQPHGCGFFTCSKRSGSESVGMANGPESVEMSELVISNRLKRTCLPVEKLESAKTNRLKMPLQPVGIMTFSESNSEK